MQSLASVLLSCRMGKDMPFAHLVLHAVAAPCLRCFEHCCLLLHRRVVPIAYGGEVQMSKYRFQVSKLLLYLLIAPYQRTISPFLPHSANSILRDRRCYFLEACRVRHAQGRNRHAVANSCDPGNGHSCRCRPNDGRLKAHEGLSMGISAQDSCHCNISWGSSVDKVSGTGGTSLAVIPYDTAIVGVKLLSCSHTWGSDSPA